MKFLDVMYVITLKIYNDISIEPQRSLWLDKMF